MSKKQFAHLIKWSTDQYSHLPWRKERTLYRTLVSEIMLQQTTVGTVLNHFEQFLLEYPTLFDLARASEEEVCVSWKGLGYYRRARNLRNLAIQIVEKFKGEIPTTLDELLALKGIGPYTANAIIAIGADKRGLAVDANLERVLARFYGVKMEKGLKLQQKMLNEFHNKKILSDFDSFSSRELNESLMDLGRIICQARKASCLLCPLKEKCVAYETGKPLHYPVENSKKLKTEFTLKLIRFVIKSGKSKIILYQKEETEWLSGQWELPTFILETNDKTLKQYPLLKNKLPFDVSHTFKTGITKYKIENIVMELTLKEFKELGLMSEKKYLLKELSETLNLSTATFKALKKIQK